MILPVDSSCTKATSRTVREFAPLASILTSSENSAGLSTAPTSVNVRTTATCLSSFPAFSPRLTCDSSVSSAIARRTFADFPVMAEGIAPIPMCTASVSRDSNRMEERLTDTFSHHDGGSHGYHPEEDRERLELFEEALREAKRTLDHPGSPLNRPHGNTL